MAAIWRHSSLPIEPPPPVTNTTLSLTSFSASSGNTTGSLPSKSSTLISVIRLVKSRPSAISFTMSGKVCILQEVDTQMSIILFLFSGVRVGMAIRIVSTWHRFARLGISSVVPKISTPIILRPCLSLSSSTARIMLISFSAFLFISWIRVDAASPAPTSKTRRRFLPIFCIFVLRYIR